MVVALNGIAACTETGEPISFDRYKAKRLWVIDRALHAAALLNAPDLPVKQVVLHPGLAVLVAVLHSHDVPTGIVGQLLGGPTAGLDIAAVARQIIRKLCPSLEAGWLLEQPPGPVVGIALEHVAVRAEHREHAALGVIGELGAVAAVRLNIILVGANQPCHLVATIAGL